MALPPPPKPTRPGLNAPNQTLQHHLPSPVMTITEPQRYQSNPTPVQSIDYMEEKKQTQTVNVNGCTVSTIFDTKYNTKDIDWNELYDLAITKGRTVYAHEVLQSHYILQQNETDNWCIKQKAPTDEIKNNDDPNCKYVDTTDLSDEILKFIRQIFNETHIVLEAHNLLHSHTNWETQVDDNDGISIYYRSEDSKNGIHSIKTNYTSKCHPVDLICVINEFDLLKDIVTLIPMETNI